MKTTYTTFTRDMARAYRDGRKKMTRRVIKWPKWLDPSLTDTSLERIAEIINSNVYRGVVKRGICDGVEHQYRCPYGNPGDQLILGTTWAVSAEFDQIRPTELTPHYTCSPEPIKIWSYFDSDEKPEWCGKLRPGLFLPGFLRDRMPRETLKIVRAERVQDITNDEAILEGIFETPRDPGFDCWSTYGMRDYYPTPRDAFKALWNSINAGRGYTWESNSWNWALGW